MPHRNLLKELFALASHVHPYVSHGATRLLSAETFVDIGENPFQEFFGGMNRALLGINSVFLGSYRALFGVL